jgi:YopX protein
MEFKKRKIKFKAWDQEHKLLMRLNSIDCNKGELMKKNHVLLQFTGLYDKDGEEIYEMDVLLLSLEKLVVFWNESKSGWYHASLKNPNIHLPLLDVGTGQMKRFCSYLELQPQ